jgi:hypothetical protein
MDMEVEFCKGQRKVTKIISEAMACEKEFKS